MCVRQKLHLEYAYNIIYTPKSSKLNPCIHPRPSAYTDAHLCVCTHVYAVPFKVLSILQQARKELFCYGLGRVREANLLQQVECQGWVAVDGREHHHLTEQSDLNGLLYLCQSLQDHLKYCWVPLKGEDKGLKL